MNLNTNINKSLEPNSNNERSIVSILRLNVLILNSTQCLTKHLRQIITHNPPTHCILLFCNCRVSVCCISKLRKAVCISCHQFGLQVIKEQMSVHDCYCIIILLEIYANPIQRVIAFFYCSFNVKDIKISCVKKINKKKSYLNTHFLFLFQSCYA